MVAKNISKQELLRIRVYKFYEENKELGKKYTVGQFHRELFIVFGNVLNVQWQTR